MRLDFIRSQKMRWAARTMLVLALLVGTVPQTYANLTGSKFEGNDGNLVVDTLGDTDWVNQPSVNIGIDDPSGPSDNSFGQGTKEDNPTVTIVSGSIPPNKSDLTRFYEASEFASNSNFLYLAWERSNVLGSANMDFEINQNATPNFSGATLGTITINRAAGDLLVTYDFTTGGGNPVLGLLTWVTSGATTQCFASNSLPCWGNRVDLSAAGDAEGQVNLGTVTDPLNNNASLPALTFGEAAINLTKAGVFPAGTCKAFGSVFLKSRASASFTAEVKDFVAPVPVNISNCGEIKIIKHTDPRGIDQSFSYTSSVPGAPAFSLNDAGNTTADNTTNTKDITNVAAGSYTVTEGPAPNFALESLTCASSVGSSGSQDATVPAQADISLVPNGLVTCTYVNKQLLGAIKVSKTSIKGTPLAAAMFSIKDPSGAPISVVTTGANGSICVDHLPFGTYTVQETAAPAGFSIDNSAAQSVIVGRSSTCGDGNEAVFSATDTPLTDLSVSVHSEAAGGTRSRITCVDASTANIGNSPQPSATTFGDPETVTANGLKPGTYTCSVIIDP
jgi:hypothetical protein